MIDGTELLHTLWMIPIAILWAFENATRIRKGKNIDHSLEFMLRVFVASVIMVFVYGGYSFAENWYLGGMFYLAEGFLFWAVFDPMVNIFRFRDYKKWGYVGETARTDEVVGSISWLTPDVYLSLKVFAYGALLFTYGIIIG